MDTERKAGNLERYHIARDGLKLDTCVAVSARYAGSPLDASALFPALRQVLLDHRALSVQIEPSSRPSFVRLPAVDLTRVVRFSPDDAPFQIAAKSILMTRSEVESTDPLWRLYVLRDNTVVFAFHHAIGDGKSGVAFHRSLLTALNQRAQESEPECSSVVSIATTLSLIPPLEEAMDLSISVWTFIQVIYAILAPLSWRSLSSTYTGTPVSGCTFDLGIRFLTVSAGDARHLLSLCKHHQATLTSFLHTVAVVVLSDLVSSLPNVTFTKLSTVVPVSLRPYTHVPDTVFCDHISTHASCVNIRDYSKGGDVCNPHEFPWHAASRFAKTLSEKAKSTREHVGLLKLVSGPLEDFILGRQGKKRDETMELSNIGRFPADESTPASDPRWTIEDTYIVQSDAICGSAFKIMIIGSPAGSIGITINWTVGVVDEVLAESFVTRFTKLIDAFCASRGERS